MIVWRWAFMAVVAVALGGCVSTSGTNSASQPVFPPGSPNSKFADIGGVDVAYEDFKNSAFPYHGMIPPDDDHEKPRPFLDVDDNGRLGHSSPRGGLHFEDTTYNDPRVLIAAAPDFNPNAPAALVVLFHGNEATLARDVVDRQQAPRQLAQSSLNAVLLAPQMAVDARDSSAGNFWRPGGLSDFLHEAEGKLVHLYPSASRATFHDMPVVIVAYSGGYLPAAFSLDHGGAADRVRGVVLMDALYGEPEKFAQWIERDSRGAFFVSAYSTSSREQNLALEAMLRRDGVNAVDGLPNSIGPGVVAFVDAGAASHEDFLTSAWTSNPLTDVLDRMGR